MDRMISPQQKRVLALIREDHSNKQIGSVLNMSEQTVKNHVSRILLKLGVGTRTGAVVKAIRLGIIDL